jgi:thioredoxin reductase
VTVSDVEAFDGGGFRVLGGGGEYLARHVILAIGRRGIPRKLGIPGEDLPNVAYALKEPEAYRGDRITVVGGGDSAVEAGLALADQPGNEVRIAYRGSSFSRTKAKNRERVKNAVDRGALSVLWSTEVVENSMDQVVTRGAGRTSTTLPNDHLFVFAGGELPTPFLERCGVQIDTKFGEP